MNPQSSSSPSRRPDVSVVICTRDRSADLAAHLPRIVASCQASAHECEIVVVDNAPSDQGTAELVASTSCVYALEAEQGLGRARNTGVSVAKGNVLLFVDDDVEVPVDWVDEMSRPILAQECDLVAGAIRPGEGRVLPWMGNHFRSTLLLEPVDGEQHHLIGASFSCHRRVFERVSFDPALGAGSPYGSAEDVFFYEQAKAAGFVTHGCSRAPVLHNFDLARLRHRALRRTASAIGRSDAYVAHHWRHSPLGQLRLRIAFDWLRLEAVRRRRFDGDGMSDMEFKRRIALAFKRQLLRERSTPPRYERLGLVREVQPSTSER